MRDRRHGTGIPWRVLAILLGFSLTGADCAFFYSSSGGDDDDDPDLLCPVADAGPDREVPVGNSVVLDGSDSRNAGLGTIEYDWVLVTVPAGSGAALSDAGTVSPRFTADVAGEYTAELEVRAGGCTSDPDTVTITAVTGNAAPTADAGGDRRIAPGALLRLDGSASGDADGEPVSYNWEIAERPTGSTAVILDPHEPRPRLVPDAPGEYRVRLVVDDGWKTSEPDEVRVIAEDPGY